MSVHSIQEGIPARAKRETRRIASEVAQLQAEQRHEEASSRSYQMIMDLPRELIPHVMETFRAELEKERRKRGL